MKEYIILITIMGFTSLTECREFIEPGSSCTTPDGKPGICHLLTECPRLELLKKKKHNPYFTSYLQKSICANIGQVCCPDATAAVTKPPGTNLFPVPQHHLMPPFNTSGDDKYPRMLSSPHCGVSKVLESRIQGGVPSILGAWPWMAALGCRDTSEGAAFVDFHCGGSLVSDRHIITAAHCNAKKLEIARLGDLNIDDDVNDGAHPVDYEIRGIFAHPEFGKDIRLAHDIAIVYLRTKVHFTDNISPICLPKLDKVRNMKLEGTTPYVIGWGRTGFFQPRSSHLLEVQLPIISNQKCDEMFSSLDKRVTSNHICTQLEDEEKDACTGDSGGPLMIREQKSFYLIGIVSYGKSCGEYPGVFTRVINYLDWIHKNLV